MLGSEFVAAYAKKGYVAWEAAALELARAGQLTPWPWVDLHLTIPGSTDTATLRVSSDVLAVGSLEDHVRLPLTPSVAQSILNLSGALLTTPWLEYQIYRAAPAKLAPKSMVPNKGADLLQYAAHSAIIDGQLANLGAPPGSLVTGIKKGVVVSNLYHPGKVLIFGWYLPPPAPDVFDDHRSLAELLAKGIPTTERQPIQPDSNAHGDFYIDYSHGIRAVAPIALVNGQPMPTIDLYTHPTLSRFVSNEGPLKVPRYPSKIAPASPPPPVGGLASSSFSEPGPLAPLTPGPTSLGLEAILPNEEFEPSTGRALFSQPRTHLVPVRVMRSQAAQMRGVTSALDIPPGGGLWFPGVSTLTMAHTPLDLDALALDANGVVLHVSELRALDPKPYPMGHSRSVGVLEVASGTIRAGGIALGDQIRLHAVSVE